MGVFIFFNILYLLITLVSFVFGNQFGWSTWQTGGTAMGVLFVSMLIGVIVGIASCFYDWPEGMLSSPFAVGLASIITLFFGMFLFHGDPLSIFRLIVVFLCLPLLLVCVAAMISKGRLLEWKLKSALIPLSISAVSLLTGVMRSEYAWIPLSIGIVVQLITGFLFRNADYELIEAGGAGTITSSADDGPSPLEYGSSRGR